MKAWGHKVRCVIRLTNMGEMDRSAKTPSQLLGDLDRLHRHFREVDWDDDVSNFQRFHAYSMNPHSPWLGIAWQNRTVFCAALSRDAVRSRSRAENEWHQTVLRTLAGRHPRPKLAGRLTENAFECAIELRERLKADVVCDFADAEIRVQQPVARVFQAHTRNVIGEL